MSRSASSSFAGAIQSFEENDDLLKLVSLRELPKSRYATKLAVTVYSNTRRGRKAVFSHVEVFKMVENVAGRLRESGVRPGTVCAYALPTSFESVIYFFALMWIGGIAAPIDPSLSAEEFENALRSLNAAILVTPYVDDDDDDLEAKAASAVKSLGICGWHIHRTINEGVLLETHSQVLGAGAAWAGGAGDFKIDPDEIAIHMSSAIAVVPLSHRVLCYAAKSFVSTYGAPISESTVLAAPLYEMHGILVLISLFYYGGHVVLPGFGGFTSEKFWDLAKKHQVTWLSASQEQVLDLYEDIQKSAAPASAITPLSFIRVEGQNSIAPEILQEMEKIFGSTVFESYGTAESCGFATTNRSGRTRHGTQGTSVNGCAVAIFDHSTRECCAPGVAGEIAVTGLHVTSSYLDSSSAQDSVIFETEEIRADEFGETKVVNTWFATGDRGTIDEEGYLVVHGNSRTLRAAELAAMEKLRLEEQAEAERKAKLEMQEKLAAEERRAEEARLQEERELQLKREEEKRIEEERKKEEEERREQKAREAATLAADLDARERKLRELEALTRAGVQNPEDLDEETANAILRRLEAIEENHRRLQADLESRNADELEEMRLRVAEAEAEAASALSRDGNAQGPMMIDVRMEELEAAVMAAAASAESSANNTREAVKAAREVAEATHGTNRSQPVDIKPSTGDQGALTKTVRVALDEVERAMQQHPAVEVAKAFGRKDKKFGAEVFCAITPKRGARVSEPWLKLFAQSQLAAAMVPKHFYYMAEIPKNITRRELAESPLLKDLSSFAGYTEVKHVKGPSWKPAKDRTKRPPMGI